MNESPTFFNDHRVKKKISKNYHSSKKKKKKEKGIEQSTYLFENSSISAR